jgi:chaperonin GroEL
MHSDNIIEGKEAIEGLLRGVRKITDLIKPTYGGYGSNIIVESHLRPYNIIANDAWTIIKALQFNDKSEKRALAFMKEICEKTDKISGDGRKTTILLCGAILQAGYDTEGDKLQLKKELDGLIPLVEQEIEKRTVKIEPKDILSVATTASESEETGKLLLEIYQQIGKDGIIDVEGSGTYDTGYTLTKDGVRFDMAGYLSASMVHDEQAVKDKLLETRAVYENPLVLVTKKKIATDDDINPLLSMMLVEGKKDLVIFTNDMDSGVAAMLVSLHQSKRFNICIIKAPSLWQEYYFEDFAKCTGATIVEDATGLNLRKLPFSALGTCGKIIVEENETVLMGIQDISEHVEQLKAKGDDDSQLRLSWLAKNTAKIRLGSNSETDLSYKRLKCNDAVRSSKLALQYGVVTGGGWCLLEIADEMPDTVAGSVLKSALSVPYDINMSNSNDELEILPHIVDASKVVSNAVRNAIGIASTMLTQKGIVYIPDMSPEEMAYNIAMSKHNAF